LRTSNAGRTDAIARVPNTIEVHVLLEPRQPVTIEIPTRKPVRARWAVAARGTDRPDRTVDAGRTSRTSRTLRSQRARSTLRTCRALWTLRANRTIGTSGTRWTLGTGWAFRPRRPLQASVRDRGLQLPDLGPQRPHRLSACLLGAGDLAIGARERPRHEQRGLVTTERRISVETSLRERIGNTERRDLRDRAGGPVIARHVSERGHGRRGRSTTGARSNLIQQPIDQNGRLVPSQRLSSEERAVREASLEPRISQFLDRANAPVSSILPLNDEEGNADGEQHGPHGKPTNGRTIERSHGGTTST